MSVVTNNSLLYPELSYGIIGIMFEVYNDLGPGFKEKHYQKAAEIAFRKNGVVFIAQCPYVIRFQGNIVGRYYMDFLIENKIVIELKRGDYFSRNNIRQIKNYPEATGHKLGILIHFTTKGLKYKRILNIY